MLRFEVRKYNRPGTAIAHLLLSPLGEICSGLTECKLGGKLAGLPGPEGRRQQYIGQLVASSWWHLSGTNTFINDLVTGMEWSVPDFADDTTLGGAVTTLEAAVLRSLLDRLEKQTQKNHTKFF